MTTELNWIANTPVSFLHAAETIAAERTVVDTALAGVLSPSVDTLVRAIDTLGVSPASFFRVAIPLAYQEPNERPLSALVLRKLTGVSYDAETLAELVAALIELKQCGTRAQPRLLDDLALRSGPIREQWEARGPGLLAQLSRITEPELLVEQATVYVVHPLCGGGGAAHPFNNSVRIEAVLANSVAALPEVVRLAWLLASLNTDLPRYTDLLQTPLRALIPVWGLIPAVIDAAAELEVIAPQSGLTELAVRGWDVGWPSNDVSPGVLDRWWQTYRELRPAWSVALRALEQMIDS